MHRSQVTAMFLSLKFSGANSLPCNVFIVSDFDYGEQEFVSTYPASYRYCKSSLNPSKFRFYKVFDWIPEKKKKKKRSRNCGMYSILFNSVTRSGLERKSKNTDWRWKKLTVKKKDLIFYRSIIVYNQKIDLHTYMNSIKSLKHLMCEEEKKKIIIFIAFGNLLTACHHPDVKFERAAFRIAWKHSLLSTLG